jgi:phosphoadenosine phosphosulfate reductase
MASSKVNEALVAELETIAEPQDLIRKLIQDFGNRAAIITSGQLTGMAMIDLAIQSGVTPRVATIDTLRLFKETYALFEETEKHYQIKIERVTPDPKKLTTMVSDHGEYLFFDSKDKQKLCCNLRKVKPNNRILDTLDVWFTGLRADQSAARSGVSRFEIIQHGPDKRPLLKVAPLVTWNEEQLRTYIKANNVPTHKLLNWSQDGWYYESLGCVMCTTPIGPTEARRAGRWRWFKDDDDKECGLHVVHKDEV